MYEAPFTKTGKSQAHGVADQWKRRTIVSINSDECSLTFPSVTKRIAVGSTIETAEVPPLEVAIEEMQAKVRSLQKVLMNPVTDMKMLQMQIQGSCGVTVNAGPLEYASAFLGNRNDYNAEGIQRLRSVFDQLLHILSVGLAQNARMVQSDQQEYHRNLTRGFMDLKQQLRQYYEADASLSAGGDDVNLERELERLRPRVDATKISFLQD